MITINIYYKGSNGSAKRFAEEMLSSGIVEEIRNKEGNICYDYFSSLEDEETILLIDKWSEQKALDEHHNSDIMDKIINLREKYQLTMVVNRYVEDVDGIPEYDRTFIVESRE